MDAPYLFNGMKNCSRCISFEFELIDQDDVMCGKCCRNPPQLVALKDGETYTGFPEVCEFDVCGCFHIAKYSRLRTIDNYAKKCRKEIADAAKLNQGTQGET